MGYLRDTYLAHERQADKQVAQNVPWMPWEEVHERTNQQCRTECDSHPVTCVGLSPVRLGDPIGQRGSRTQDG